MTKFLAIIAFVAVIAFCAADFESDWNDFKVKYGRQFGSSSEEAFRKEIFHKNWEKIDEHNKKYARGEVTWTMGVNKFADRTKEEMKKMMRFIHPLSTEFDSEWENFKIKFEKTYQTAEQEAYRKGIFLKNLEEITEHNKKYAKGEVSWSMGVNDFTDLTAAEFARTHAGVAPSFTEEEFQREWVEFKMTFGRQYESLVEESFRKGIFRVNWEMAVKHNKKYAKGEVTWKMGTNNFTDWTKDEFGSHLMRPLFAYSTSFDSEWENFKNKFGRSYESAEEEAFRKGIFLKNWEMITEHNKKYEKGEVTWKMGVNDFTDRTREEFGSRLNPPLRFSKEQFKADWESFKVTHGRQYENSVEEAFRRGIFRFKWEMIVEHNRKFEKGEISWKMGVNNFTDWTGEEFGSSHLMRPITLHPNDV